MMLLNPQDTDAVKFTALMYQDYINRQCENDPRGVQAAGLGLSCT
jgi:hypothetical protein